MYQVNFDKVFISGILKGHRYHDFIIFSALYKAVFFAKNDGAIITPCVGNDDYKQENSKIIFLQQHDEKAAQ